MLYVAGIIGNEVQLMHSDKHSRIDIKLDLNDLHQYFTIVNSWGEIQGLHFDAYNRQLKIDFNNLRKYKTFKSEVRKEIISALHDYPEYNIGTNIRINDNKVKYVTEIQDNGYRGLVLIEVSIQLSDGRTLYYGQSGLYVV